MNPPDLTIPKQVNNDERFSVFNPRHARCADALINIFMACEDLGQLISISTYARDQLNPVMFNYCLAVVVKHRLDTKDFTIPTLLESSPDRFFDTAVFEKAREEVFEIPENLRVPIDVPLNFDASDSDEERRCAYWREDIGLNQQHWHWHIAYPFLSTNPAVVYKNRRGELFYYMHQQILARYNFERLCSSLARVTALNFRDPIKEGYLPKGHSSSPSRWAPRPANMVLQSLNRDVDEMVISLDEFESHIARLYECVNSGNMTTTTGDLLPLTEKTGMDILGNLIEASTLSLNPKYYGNMQNNGHLLIGYIHDPENKFLDRLGVMADPATDMRDPAFYRLHTSIDNIFQTYKEKLHRYTTTMLGNKKITLTSVEVTSKNGTPNQLETFWMQTNHEISQGMRGVKHGEKVFARTTHLTHTPFTYRIRIHNAGSSAKKGTVRIFIAPKFDERGQPWKFTEHRHMFIEMDNFPINMVRGHNTVIRGSDESSVTIPFDKIYRSDEEIIDFCGCGWPQNLLLPRGTGAGMACILFVMISDYEQDKIVFCIWEKIYAKGIFILQEKIDQSLGGVYADSASYCGTRDKLFPDKRSMGFPFDRPARPGVDTIQQFITPNMKIQDIVIHFTNRTEQNPKNSSAVSP